MAMNEQNPTGGATLNVVSVTRAIQVRTFRTRLTRIHCLRTPKLQHLNGNQSPKVTKNRKKNQIY